MNKWMIIIPLLIIVLILARLKKRGYFWKDKYGKKLSFKQFLRRYRDGLEGVTPLQQVKVTLWGYPFIFGGVIWGIVVTILAKTYWLSIILAGSLPISSMQLLNNYQKFRRLKEVEKAMEEANFNRK